VTNCRQKPGSAARASVGPDIRNTDSKHPAVHRIPFAMSLLPQTIPFPLPKAASQTLGIWCSRNPEASARQFSLPSAPFRICERASHCTLKARRPPVLFFCVPQPLSRQRSRADAECFRIATPRPSLTKEPCGQPCPACMIARAAQDGRMARRCYSSHTGLLSAVRTRIVEYPQAHRRTSFLRAARSSSSRMLVYAFFKPDTYGRIRRKHG